MAFDKLPDHNLQMPTYHPMTLPPPPVYNTQAVVDHGVEQINKIIDAFSPLTVAERKAKLAMATYQLKAIQLAQQGHPEMLQMLKDPTILLKLQKMALGIKGQQLSNTGKQLYNANQSKKLQGADDPRNHYRIQAGIGASPLASSISDPPPVDSPDNDTENPLPAAEGLQGVDDGTN